MPSDHVRDDLARLELKGNAAQAYRSNRSSLETKDEMLSVNAGAFDLKTQSKEDELRMPLMRDIKDRQYETSPESPPHLVVSFDPRATPNPSG